MDVAIMYTRCSQVETQVNDHDGYNYTLIIIKSILQSKAFVTQCCSNMSDIKRKYISSTSEHDTSINTSVNSPPEVKKPKKKKGKGSAKKQKMAESNEELKYLSKSIEDINRKLNNTLSKDDKKIIQEIMLAT